MDIFNNPDELIKEAEENEERREAHDDLEKEAEEPEDHDTDQRKD